MPPRSPQQFDPPRMAALARLPVFLDLAGKTALVAGGSAAAAWKAELLAAAGASVQIHANAMAPEMAALLARGAASGSLTHVPARWTPQDFAGVAVAIADATGDDEAAAFHTAARAAGVPVNVIDRAEFCQFEIGSIVNRSPVVIGISTAGAAPILAQAIRRRIETLLPPALAAWAALARSLRTQVMQHKPSPARRRAFWEAFASRAFGPPPAITDPTALITDLSTPGTTRTGRVTLVGAGPGDAELLTLKAVRALQAADVILFDDLVSDDVLELARREAHRMLVGKRGGRDSCKQEEINALMLKLAGQGKHVVRLKSGDPMIFGRAGEEIAELRAAGIAVDVVPGITAALAMASALGVSLTHRDHAQSLRLVTGHGRHGALPNTLDWRGLADPGCTLIFYMAGRTAPEIAQCLLAHGLAATTPAVLVESLSRPGERRWSGTLDQLEHAVATGFDGPVLIGIGAALAIAATQAIDNPDVTLAGRTAA